MDKLKPSFYSERRVFYFNPESALDFAMKGNYTK